MKAQNLLRSVVLAGAAVGGTANAVIVFSDDFESTVPPVFLPAGSFLAASGSGTPIGNFGNGWTLTGGIDLIREAFLGAHTFGAINNVSVDLSGSPGPGKLEHAFDFVAGLTYTLNFDYFRNAPGTNLTVQFAGFTFGLPAASISGVEHETLSWTPTSSGTGTFSFAGDSGFFGPTIDNIVLTAVPEPGPTALLLSGLCVVGFLARRRMHSS